MGTGLKVIRKCNCASCILQRSKLHTLKSVVKSARKNKQLILLTDLANIPTTFTLVNFPIIRNSSWVFGNKADNKKVLGSCSENILYKAMLSMHRIDPG